MNDENEYNYQLCKERHQQLGEWCKGVEDKIDKLENRFLAMITTLLLNFVGVIVLLILQIISKHG